MSRRAAAGPGLAKCGVERPFARRTVSLTRCADALWVQWLEKVDVVSEGMESQEDGALVYRGSTSLIVLSDRHGGLVPHGALAEATQVARCDPHFWLRATRAARLEAACRCSGALGCLHVELTVKADPRGIRADIDCDGRVVPAAHAVKRKL